MQQASNESECVCPRCDSEDPLIGLWAAYLASVGTSDEEERATFGAWYRHLCEYGES